MRISLQQNQQRAWLGYSFASHGLRGRPAAHVGFPGTRLISPESCRREAARLFLLLRHRVGSEGRCLQRVGLGAGLLGFRWLADSGYRSLLNWHGDILSSRLREGTAGSQNAP